MKYFNPSYWFKLWILSAPLFNSENKGIYAKSVNNDEKIKDWVSKNTSSLESINESNSFTNISNYQPYSLNETNQNIDSFYQSYLNLTKYLLIEKNKRNKRENIEDLTEKINKIFIDIDFLGFLKVVSIIDNFNGLSLAPNAMYVFNDNTDLNCCVYFIYQSYSYFFEYNQLTKTTIVTNKDHQIYKFSSDYMIKNKNNENYLYLKKYKYFKRNYKVYEEHIITGKNNTIINDNIYMNGIILNDRIYYLGDDYKLYEYCPFQVMFEQDELLISWTKSVNRLKENINLDLKNTFHSKSIHEKEEWIRNRKNNILDKIDNLHDKIQIIRNRENIEELRVEINSLNNKFNNLKLQIENLIEKSQSGNLSGCSETFGFISSISSIIPGTGIGEIISLTSSVISASCSITSFYLDRTKRDVININDLEEKNITKWTDEFTKSINHEQHLSIENKTNFITNNITSL